MSLTPRLLFGSVDLTDFPYALIQGETSLGSGEAVRATLESRLYDGEIVTSSRTGNREIEFEILVEGASLADLSLAEAALVAECDKARNTLWFEPGDGFGKATVFDTFRAQLTLNRDDDEESATLRRYLLTIPALPFGRSASLSSTSVAAVPTTFATQVAAWDTATGWSSTTGSPVASSTYFTEGTAAVQVPSVRVASLSTASLDVYEQVDTFTIPGGYTPGIGGGWFAASIRHSSLSPLGYTAAPLGCTQVEVLDTSGRVLATVVPSVVAYLGTSGTSAGFYRYAVPVTASTTVGGLRFTNRMVRRVGSSAPSVRYDDLRFGDTSSLSRFVIATVPVPGSVRAPGSIQVASPSATALGDVLVLTTDASAQPATFLPACRAAGYQSAGTNTTTANLLNPNTAAITTGYTGLAVDVPVSSLTPGGFEVWLRCTNTSTATFAAQAQLVVGGTAVGALSTTEGDSYGSSASHRWVSAGVIQLPPQSMPNVDPTAMVRIQVKTTAGTGAVDELVLAPTQGAVTIITAGTGTASTSGDSSYVWVDAPSVELPNGGWFRGTSADRINARAVASSELTSPGRHVFTPSSIRVYVATPNVAGATARLDHYPTYHTMAAS